MSESGAKSQETTNLPALAAELADRVDLVDIRLIETAARCTPAMVQAQLLPPKLTASPHAPANQLPERLRFQVTHECQRGENALLVFLNLTVDALPQGESPEPLLHVDGRFLLVYVLRTTDGITDEHCDAFAEYNAIFNAWPYWREYVQSATVRMGLPGLILPVYRFGQRFGGSERSGVSKQPSEK